MHSIIRVLCLMVFIFLTPNLFADQGNHRHILILHSYHSTFPWTQSINQALTNTLEGHEDDLHISVEYMDTKHFPLPAVEDNLIESYKIKYTDPKPDVLIVSDNNALMFSLENRGDLFKDVPIIFSGINNFSPDMFGQETNITGVAEAVDMVACLNLVGRLQPEVKELVAIADYTTTGQMNLQNFRKKMRLFSHQFKTRELIGLTDKEIIPILNTLPSSSAVFYLSFFQDRFGKARNMKENIEILAENSSVPVYVLWDWAIPFGATGGVVTSGRMQGIHAGEMALKVLNNVPLTEIPVLQHSSTEVVVNHPKAVRYNLNFNLIPEQTVLFDSPESFYYKHRSVILSVIGIIVFLVGGIAILLTMMKRERNASFELVQQKKLLNDILFNLPYFVFWKDRNFVYQGANQAFSELFGFSSPDDLIGKTDKDFAWTNDYADFYHKFDDQVINSGVPVLNIEEPYVSMNNKRSTLLISKVPLKDAEGNVTGVLGMGLDISERIKLETQLRQAQKMDSVGRLAGGVAHDFNNMLSIIIGNAEMMLEDLDSANPLISNLEEIQKAAQRSTSLTRQLLAFARKQVVAPKIVNLNYAVNDMIKMLKRLMGEDIDLLWRPAESLWPVKIDPSQIDQILANLCVNARDSIKDVGKVTIETKNTRFDEDYCKDHPGFMPGEYAMMAVSDNGFGIEKEVLDNLFEPFFTTKKLGEGTGLGLSTVYGIVKQNNGFIDVYSEPEHGTTFKIYLPKHTGNISVEEQTPDDQAPERGNETILLVEDEKAILTITKVMLENLGYTVLEASTPEEAINLCNISGAEIHLLITDVVMPSMNGRILNEKILQLFPNMKCLYMSGYTANVIAHRGILAEGLNFINKPFSKKELSIKLREILDCKNTLRRLSEVSLI